MKFGLRTLLVALLVTNLVAFGALGQETLTLGSKDAPRLSTGTGLVDYWVVRAGPGSLISLFGLNTGNQQFIQLFDSAYGPTLSITAWDNSLEIFTNATHGLSPGQAVQLGVAVAGISAGIYYARPIDANSFSLYDTKAHALTGGTTGRQDVTGTTSTATMNLVPLHTFAIDAANNYFCTEPTTGISFSKGLVIAVSTGGPLYVPGGKDVTMLVTLVPGL